MPFSVAASFSAVFATYTQKPEVGLDYTALVVKQDVVKRYCEPLSLTKSAELMEKGALHEKDTLYIVHYPKEEKYLRSENPGNICVLQGKLVKPRLFVVKHVQASLRIYSL